MNRGEIIDMTIMFYLKTITRFIISANSFIYAENSNFAATRNTFVVLAIVTQIVT